MVGLIPTSKSFSKIKGDDPIIVIVPPKIAQNPIGIKSRDIGWPVRDDTRDTTGKNNAAAPTFCMNDEITPTVLDIRKMIRFSVAPPTLEIHAATDDITPVRSSPAPMIITAMIDTTAFDPNPSNRWRTSTKLSSPGIKVRQPSKTMMQMATTSTRTTSVTNSVIVNAKTAKTAIISKVRPNAAISSSIHKSFTSHACTKELKNK